MKYDDRNISNIGELLDCLADQIPENEQVWFRGHADTEWGLTCTLARNGGMQNEFPLIRRFKQNALPLITNRPGDEWEWLFLMQHHGLPTRLLDWSESVLVALYFAVNDDGSDHEDEDGCIWALLPHELNAISLRDDNAKSVLGLGDDKHFDDYLPSKIGAQVQTFQPLAATAVRNNPRIQMQQGVFTVSHKDLSGLDELPDTSPIWKLIIPAGQKAVFRSQLKALNLSKLSLFPELSNAAEHARSLV
ncbi:FRG domain-containing protein [uncultured Ruegeria sp.]|uniref:FRG domain-containing protein n=1 Tax=uncultured Ruegeria sp. TaxID=259304 RepID=UPI00261CBBAA|nr:FRG domain-containing protein [uncultured Ruegeria sp.]